MHLQQRANSDALQNWNDREHNTMLNLLLQFLASPFTSILLCFTASTVNISKIARHLWQSDYWGGIFVAFWHTNHVNAMFCPCLYAYCMCWYLWTLKSFAVCIYFFSIGNRWLLTFKHCRCKKKTIHSYICKSRDSFPATSMNAQLWRTV